MGLWDSVQVQGAGAAPPQMGARESQRRGFRRTRAGAGGAPAVRGRGGAIGTPSGPLRCLDSSGVVWRATEAG
jgi:hypothetical protein